MSAWLGRRTAPRVDFREAVRVLWPGEVSGVLARAVNLSSSGILVDAPTPTPCPVGSDVLCDVALPGGPRLLRGRVAHRRELPSEKVGMGIEFVDLSPHEAAELRDVVDDSEQRPQRVKVRFRGTEHVVSARAFATVDGFRLATALPFLKADTEVDVALSPDASVSARGRVARVALEVGAGAPRLLIDVRVEDDDARTPVVETVLEAVPEHVWEPDELGATAEPATAAVSADDVPTVVTAGLAGVTGVPSAADPDRTEIVSLDGAPSRWRALGGGVVAGAIAFLAFVAAIVIMKVAAPAPAPAPSIAPPVIATTAPPPVTAPPAPAAAEPAASAAGATAPAVAPSAPEATAPAIAPSALEATAPAVAPSADEPARPLVALTGSIAGAKRYPLRNPDGVAFNLPHARAAMKVGTYTPDAPGLKAMWVRALPGGGTHLRFFFTAARSAPRLVLERDGVRVGGP
jgi:hypothetical protein